mmetsp:Transcript_21818/g.49702  ORF Transcript_21818/g.49702 Transcript_21818/m.49702 type:complete len:300 (-) Transcript_21818:1706-2605(-)
MHLESGNTLRAAVQGVALHAPILGRVLEPLVQDLGHLGHQLRVLLAGRGSAHHSLARAGTSESACMRAVDPELEVRVRNTRQSVPLIADVVSSRADIAFLLGRLGLRVGRKNFPLGNPHGSVLNRLRHPADFRGTGLIPGLALLLHRHRMPSRLVALAGVGIHVVHAGPGVIARELGGAIIDVDAELLSAGLHDLFKARVALAPVEIIRSLRLGLHLLALAIGPAAVDQAIINLHYRGDYGELAAGKALQGKLGVGALVRIVIAAQGMARHSSVRHNRRKEHIDLDLRGGQLDLRGLSA